MKVLMMGKVNFLVLVSLLQLEPYTELDCLVVNNHNVGLLAWDDYSRGGGFHRYLAYKMSPLGFDLLVYFLVFLSIANLALANRQDFSGLQHILVALDYEATLVLLAESLA